jgi:hypothetical protein
MDEIQDIAVQLTITKVSISISILALLKYRDMEKIQKLIR